MVFFVVRVSKDSKVFVEKNGLPLPLAGLPSGVSDNTKGYLGASLCRYMGFR